VLGLPHEVHGSTQRDRDEERVPERLVVRHDHDWPVLGHVLRLGRGEAAQDPEQQRRGVLHDQVERPADALLACDAMGVVVRDCHGRILHQGRSTDRKLPELPE
jgi:hypothetical protein